jgi:O-antigen ligase
VERPPRSYQSRTSAKAGTVNTETLEKPPVIRAFGTPPNPAAPLVQVIQPNGFQKAGFVLLCVYLISNLANDWSIRLLNERAFLSLIAGVLLPFACLVAGTALRGLRFWVGRWWLAVLAWALVTIPFSSWRGGSFSLIQEFALKNWPLLFYAAAAVLTLGQCRKLFYVMNFGAVVVISACYFFGEAKEGRLAIPNSLFFDNPNDLALQLLLGVMFCAYLLMSRNVLHQIFGAILIGVSILLILKTGSRANFLSVIVCLITALIVVQRKLRLVILTGVVLLIAPLFVSANQWSRLVYIVWAPEEEKTVNGDLESQIERTELFKKAVVYTVTHPLFGLGPGQFGDVVWADAKAAGTRFPSLGTHNTYLQVASEMGFPALIFYLGALYGSLSMNLRLYRRAARDPRMSDVANMALCLFLALVAYSFSTLFHHVAYSRQFPTLAGLTIALWAAAAAQFPAESSKNDVKKQWGPPTSLTPMK